VCGGVGLEKLKWEGVHLKEILARSGSTLKQGMSPSTHGRQIQRQPFIQEALEPDTLLAYSLNGKNLPPENGFPLRLVIPRMYAYKSVKWVERIVFTESRRSATGSRMVTRLTPPSRVK